MQIKQVALLRKSGQAGFTLIELIVVIVILGILAATALPRFANLGADARVAKLNAARGAVQSAAAMYRGRWLASGSPVGGGTYDGTVVNSSGFPDNASIAAAAGLAAPDYDLSVPGTIAADAAHLTCSFTYTETTGVVTAAPVQPTTACD